MKHHFTAPWGRALCWMSGIATVICAFAAFSYVWMPRPQLSPAATFLNVGGPLIILAGAALFIIRGYTLTHEALVIHRLFWDTRVPWQGLMSLEQVPGAMRKSMRTCGNGGLYSFSGWYWSKSLGRYSAYVNDLNRTVVMRFKARTIVISPDQPNEFVAAVSPHITAAPP